jgi:aryl-alcohol dehydrogenase-like predicted oxidoreductase
MTYAQPGSSELLISRIGFGCMSLGANEMDGIPIIHEAISLGINFFDTADIYSNGLNETLVGKALKGKRDKVVLATKVGNVARHDGKGLDWDPSKKHILSSIDHSLKRLQTDHIDLYQLHGGTIDDPIEETIEAFEILKQQGKIRYYGISSIRPNVIAEYVKRSSIISVMMQYSLLDRRPEESCLDLLYEKKIGVLARGGLAQGLLVNKPPRPYLDLTDEEVGRAAEAVKSVSDSHRSNAQTALRYVLHHPAVTSAVVGIRTMEQLIEVAATPDTPPLTDNEIKTLKESVRPLVYKEHRI